MNLFNVNVLMLSSMVIALFMNGHILCEDGDEISEEKKRLGKAAFDNYTRDCGTLKKEIIPKLLGGKQADEHSHPWMAELKITFPNEDGNYYCAGTLIGPYHVLTTAQCLTRYDSSKKVYADNVIAYFGQDLSSVYKKEFFEIIVHENYKAMPTKWNINVENDIAIVVLKNEVVINDHIRPICLPPKSNRDFSEYNGQAIMTGWGYTQPDIKKNKNGEWEEIFPQPLVVGNLQVFDQGQILTNQYCSSIFGKYVKDEYICVGMGSHSFCYGDFGSPAIVRESEKYYQIGIVSMPHQCKSDNNYPTSCTRITYFRDWIDEKVIDTYVKMKLPKDKKKSNKSNCCNASLCLLFLSLLCSIIYINFM